MGSKEIASVVLLGIMAFLVVVFSAINWERPSDNASSNKALTENISYGCLGGTCSGCGCGKSITTDRQNATSQQQLQDVYIRALANGKYDKPQVVVERGKPVRLHFTADRNAGCGRMFVLEEFNITLIANGDEESVAEFTPEKPGEYAYHCGMWMWKGKLIVK